MKPSELIFRQNRVVYVLMTLLAIVGIVWGIREHRRHTAIPEAPGAAATPTATAPQQR